jgi:tetratricopeptide (TPR) repeat protein
MLKRMGLACIAAAAATGAAADTMADCNQTRNLRLRLLACSEVIAGLTHGPDDKARAYRNRGMVRANAGAGKQAEADFTEAVKLHPDDAASYAGRGRVRLTLGDLAGATADYTEALRVSPRQAAYYVGRGHARFVQGDLTAAIADFTEAIRLDPERASTFNRRGLAYRKSGDLARAVDDYTRALNINPIYALAYNNRGYVHEALGQKQEAIADFQAALLLDPSLIGARDGLVRLGVRKAWLAQTTKRIKDGQALVERHCSGCHAVGRSGASPNKTAPEFRSLHARHSRLALREPLSRGIAAPHDQMPKFTLTNDQIDTIIAYINSLASPPPATRAKGRKVAAAAGTDAMDIGDAAKGLAYARRVCVACHNVLRTDAPSPNLQAPSFKKIANTPGMSITALTVWSRSTHPTMPNLIIEQNDMDDLIAYILSLKEKK